MYHPNKLVKSSDTISFVVFLFCWFRASVSECLSHSTVCSCSLAPKVIWCLRILLFEMECCLL